MDGQGATEASGKGSIQYLDALVIGAGFGGMHMVHRLRELGISFRGIEAGGDVGGVWYWNRYPGARCDVMSIDYSYSFSDIIQQEWTWSEKFSTGKEILAYANFVADRLDLRRDIQFNTRVDSIEFDDATQRWMVRTDQGEVFSVTYCIMATGPLSVPKDIDVPGVADFQGQIYRAARWPHEDVSFAGKRVGVVGTGSSGIQIVPVVAEQADALWVFQRTPSFTLPMRNRRLDADYVAQIKQHYPALRASARETLTGGVRPVSTRPFFSITPEEREVLMEDAWRQGGLIFMGLFSDVLTNAEANEIVAEFVRRKIGEVVNDPDTAERLKPRGYPIFARRPCLDTNYYETYNRPNVRLVDCLTDPIERLTPRGVQTRSGEIELDAIIFATGYDALTGAMLAIDIKGRSGRPLADKWSHGARSVLGLAVEGFPNMFTICGANSPSALANIVILDEQNGQWIANCIDYMRRNGFSTIEATVEAEDEWLAGIATIAERSLMPKANTWYTGANVDGKPRGFPIYAGGLNRYREICDRVAAEGYRGFTLQRADSLQGAA